MKLIHLFAFTLSALFVQALHADEASAQAEIERLRQRVTELEASQGSLPQEAAQMETPPASQPAATKKYIRGPKGGCYTWTAGGNKKYVDRSLCD